MLFQPSDYGSYKCIGMNHKGNDSKLVSIVPPEHSKGKLATLFCFIYVFILHTYSCYTFYLFIYVIIYQFHNISLYLFIKIKIKTLYNSIFRYIGTHTTSTSLLKMPAFIDSDVCRVVDFFYQVKQRSSDCVTMNSPLPRHFRYILLKMSIFFIS